MPDKTIESRVEGSVVDPKEQQKIEKSIKGKKENAPSFAEQSGTFVDWKKIRDELGQPFIAGTPPPLRKLKEMSNDPMLRFGLHYISTPHVRAQYHMKATSASGTLDGQVAGFMDAVWRPVHPSFMMTALLSLRWGHQPMVKRFATGNPGGFYRDLTEENVENQMKPVWDEGSVEPVILKTFVPLDPARCQPLFNDSSGEFDGISWEIPSADTKKKGNDAFRKIDVYHAMWITHNRADQFGSIYGYPRLALAYRYWWSYWYSWTMVDRAIERMAIPPMLAFHPEGEWEDPTNPEETQPYFEIALDAAERLRSNAIAAVPSTLASAGLEEKGTQQREWGFEFLETQHPPVEQMLAFAQYCDIMKLRALWVPEGALIEGEGGSSQRNIATQMANIFIESQANLFDEIIEQVNKFIIPQLLVINFPEFVNDGGKCEIVGHGFAQEDTELLKQLIQLVGQANPLSLGVDIQKGLERLNVPLLDPTQQAKQLADAAAANATPPVVPGVTQSGFLPSPPAAGIAPGSTNGGSTPNGNSTNGAASVTGFEDMVVYIQPNESIELSDSEDFITSLPGSAHYSDKTMRALMLQFRRLWKSHLRDLYPDLAKHINASKLELADEGPIPVRRTVTKAAATKAANKLLKDWQVSSKRLEQLGAQSRILLTKMANRSAKLNAKNANLGVELSDELFETWVEPRIGKLLRGTHETVNSEVKNFLINEIREGHEPSVIATNLSEHFAGMSVTKADTIARSETRDAYNAGTLIAGEQADLKYVRASDGEEFDEECKERNGKLMTIREAWRESSPLRTHPRCQLGFELVARAEFSINNVTEFPEDGPDAEDTFAYFDDKTSTAYILEGSDFGATDRWLSSLVDVLVKEGYRESTPA